MPSGTGKTITLLAFILGYQQQYPKRNKLIYCSRTVPEIDKALLELQRLIAYREAMTGEKMDFVGIGLSSRRNLCINGEVLSNSTSSEHIVGKAVDSRCHSITASWVRQKAKEQAPGQVGFCAFFENLEEMQSALLIPSGVYTLEGLKEFGRQKGVCPYFLSRKAIEVANVVIYSYYYLLDPKVADLVSRNLPREAIVIFDEAHNIGRLILYL